MLKRLLIASFVIMATAAHATEIPFSPGKDVGFFSSVHAAFPGDLDGDGDLDVVATSSANRGIEWYENLGEAGAWAEHVITMSFDGRSVTVVDLDGDGDDDVLGSAFNGGGVTWWENIFGDASSWTTHAINDTHSSFSVATGDLDGDGDLDVAGNGAWWRNTVGDASTWTQSSLGTGLSDVAFGDLDSDGDSDLAGAGSNGVWWWDNEVGDAVTLTRFSIDSLTGAASVVIADIDGDGLLDVAASGDDEAAWWRWTGPGGSDWTKFPVDAAIGKSEWIRAADQDGDGDVDLLVNDRGDNFMLWYENTAGDGSTWTRWVIEAGSSNLRSLEPADLDGDGDLDAVGADIQLGRTWWWENLTVHRSATFPTSVTMDQTVETITSMEAADLDGDGDLDLLAALQTAGMIVAFENAIGDGTVWGSPATVTAAFDSARGLSFGDLNSDGHMDVVGSAGGGDELAWFENPLSAGVWTKRSVAAAFQGANPTAVADIDEDGDLDIVCAAFTDGLAWFENDALTWTERPVDPGLVGARVASVGDINADGHLDILSGTNVADVLRWYGNDGSSPPVWTPHDIVIGNVRTASLADMDGDGDLDVIAAIADISWWENINGDGTTWTVHAVHAGADNTKGLDAVDLDGDGDLDISGTSQFHAYWWENSDGSATSWISHAYSPFNGNGGWISLPGDFDGDGAVDLVAAKWQGLELGWWRNLGGQFALPTTDAVALDHPTEGTEAAVLEIQLTHRGRNGDDDVELATLELDFRAATGTALSAADLEALADGLHLYLDDGDGSWGIADSVVHSTLPPYTLNGGVMTVPLADDNLNFQTSVGSELTYFLTLDLASAAGSAATNTIVVSHLTASSSDGEMASTDIPLALEYGADTAATALTINARPVVASAIEDQTVNAGIAVTITVAASFTDPDGDDGELIFSSQGLPLGLSLSPSGLITGTAGSGAVASSPFQVTVTATDSWGGTVTDTFSLEVLPWSEIFSDDFENGDLLRWTSIAP